MPRDLERLLHDTAIKPSGPLDPAELVARGRRRRRTRHALYGAGSAAAIGVLALTAATITGPTPEGPQIVDRPPSTTDSAEPSESGSPQGLLACELPSLRPTYLPWADSEEDIGEPVQVRHGTESSPNSSVTWAADSDDYRANNRDGDLNSATVSVLHEHESAGDPFRQVEVRGHRAELVWVGDPGVGELSLTWREDDGPCGTYSVSLLVRGSPAYIDGLPDQDAFTQAEEDEFGRLMGLYQEALEREIVRIANSLTESPNERAGCAGRPQSSPAVFDASGGVYAVYLAGFDVVALEASFDVIQWLSGDEARQAYLEDTGDSDGPPNDYYIRNDSDEVRTAPVSQDADYWVVQLRTDSNADVDRTDAEGFAEEWTAGHPEDVFWLTFDDGVISEICQQYRP